MEFLRPFIRNHFAWKPVVASRNVGCFLKLLLNITFTTWASDGYRTWMVHCSDSLLAEVSHGKRRRRWDRETPCGLRYVFYRSCTCVVLITGDGSVTCDTTCRTGLRDNTCFIRARTFHLERNQFWKPGSFDHKRGRWLHERMRRRPAEVFLFPIIFLLPWEAFGSREW